MLLVVRKDQPRTEAPFWITVNRTNPSGMITTTNEIYIRMVAMRSLLRRQPAGSRKSTFCVSLATAIRPPSWARWLRPSGPPLTPRGALHDPAGEDVDDDGEDEQEHGYPQQPGAEHAGGLAELVGDDRGHAVTGGEQVRCDRGGPADHQRGRDRLAHGASQAEQYGPDDAALAVRPDRAADHLQAGGAQRVRALTVDGRHGRDDLPRQRGHDRRDHEGQDDAGGEETRPAHRLPEQRAEHRDAVDAPGDRG